MMTLFMACAGAEPLPRASRAAPVTADLGAARAFTLNVLSGRQQPAANTAQVSSDEPVTLIIRGVGPAQAKVFAPDASAVVTNDAMESGNVVHRFRPSVAGRYRVVVAGSEATELLLLDVTSSTPAPRDAGGAVASTPPARSPAVAPSSSSAPPGDRGYWCGHDMETARLPRCGCFGPHPNGTCSDP